MSEYVSEWGSGGAEECVVEWTAGQDEGVRE